MRLLSPQELIDEKQRQFDTQIRKGILLQKEIDKRERSLRISQQDYTPEKQILQKDFDQFVQKITEKKSELLRELASLETRKEIALEPLDNIRQEIAEKESELAKTKRQAEAEKSIIAQKTEELLKTQKEADAVKKSLFEWSSNLDTLNKDLRQREIEIRKQEADVSLRSKTFEETQERECKEMAGKERMVMEREQVAQAKIEEVKNQWTELQKERQHLYSQQEDLRLAFEEARRRNLL